MPVMPMAFMAFFRASRRASLQTISTLVNLGLSSLKVGIFLTGTASAAGTSPVTTLTSPASTEVVSGSIANPA